MDPHDEWTCAQKAQRTRELNDQLRTTGIGGRTMLTRAVAALPSDELDMLLKAVRDFNAFDRRNDPWGEHDFAQVHVNGEPYFWKIDCYDVHLEFGSPDPSDPSITTRVLTIMTSGDL